MLRYILRRILLAVPTLLFISMVIFGLSKCAPRDPALDLGDSTFGSLQEQEAAIRLRATQLGLDKPVFYFTLTTAAFPDTLYRIFPRSRREQLKNLCAQTGNWPAVSRYESAVREMATFADTLPDTLPAAGDFRVAFSGMLHNERPDVAEETLADVRAAAEQLPPDSQPGMLLDTLKVRVQDLRSTMQPGKMNIPAFYWHGLDNQYHHWLSGFIRGDLGLSLLSPKPVWDSLKFSLLSTLIINSLALLLAYLIAVPLGVAMARRRDRFFDRFTRWTLLLLYAMPVFWLGSLLMLFLATPDFGLFLIKGINLESYQGSGKTYSWWCISNFDKFILPILTLSLHALAILALQMRGGVLDTISQDFIRTARAKGVGENAVYWRHAFRNALFPIITVFASVFPAIFTGSLVVEYLFQFPGLGMKTYEAFLGGDYPVLFAILMLAATLTVVSNLMADLLYTWADPRVRFSK
jgi:peptide/nickel transport system permease protein